MQVVARTTFTRVRTHFECRCLPTSEAQLGMLVLRQAQCYHPMLNVNMALNAIFSRQKHNFTRTVANVKETRFRRPMLHNLRSSYRTFWRGYGSVRAVLRRQRNGPTEAMASRSVIMPMALLVAATFMATCAFVQPPAASQACFLACWLDPTASCMASWSALPPARSPAWHTSQLA